MIDNKRTAVLPKERIRRLGMTQQQFAEYVRNRDEHCGFSSIHNALNNWHEASPRTVRIVEAALNELEERK